MSVIKKTATNKSTNQSTKQSTNSDINNLITDNINVWTSAIKKRNTQGRGSSKKTVLTGIKKLRELILELAVRGKLVPQNINDEPVSVLLEKIAEEKAQLIADKNVTSKKQKQKPLPAITDEEKPFELPSNWEWTRLGIVAEINPRNSLIDDEVLASFVPMPLVTTSYKGLHGQEIRKWSEIKKGYTHFADGDIALAKITPCFENSKAAIFSDLENGIGAGTTELYIARIYGETLNRLFVLLFLKAPQFLIVGETKMTGSAGQKRVPKDFFAGNPMPLPPLAEQHRIVAKVDELMALCDQLEQQTEQSLTAHQTLVEVLLGSLLPSTSKCAAGSATESNSAEALTAMDGGNEGNAGAISFQTSWQRIADHFDLLFTTEQSIEQLKQTILQLAVMGKLVPQNPSDEPASVLLEKIAEEKAQLIAEKKIKKGRSIDSIIREHANWHYPNNWSDIELQDLFKFIDYRGKNPEKSDSGKRIITAKNIRNGFVKNDPVEFISEELYKTWMVRGLPKKLDILFVTEGHTMGFVSLVELDYEFALAQRTICFQPFTKINTKFFFYTLMSNQFQNIIKDNQTGSAAAGIKASKLKRIPVPVPPLAEQHRIVAKVDELMILCEQLKARLSDAQTTQLHLADAVVENTLN